MLKGEDLEPEKEAQTYSLGPNDVDVGIETLQDEARQSIAVHITPPVFTTRGMLLELCRIDRK